jgi:hypothetical protein
LVDCTVRVKAGANAPAYFATSPATTQKRRFIAPTTVRLVLRQLAAGGEATGAADGHLPAAEEVAAGVPVDGAATHLPPLVTPGVSLIKLFTTVI